MQGNSRFPKKRKYNTKYSNYYIIKELEKKEDGKYKYPHPLTESLKRKFRKEFKEL